MFSWADEMASSLRNEGKKKYSSGFAVLFSEHECREAIIPAAFEGVQTTKIIL